ASRNLLLIFSRAAMTSVTVFILNPPFFYVPPEIVKQCSGKIAKAKGVVNIYNNVLHNVSCDLIKVDL
ncbi:MAG: hypothetical protein ABFC95_07120, partial [Smithella sp.]